ncbi:DUF6701 domain-containing protein [Aeromonas hydrophila]|uniref:DUF6701 domain-containing protein n=1 Tax=Aeromonas hydrophila TaxID=644 RepID=UPI00191FBC4E|nr:DUF6701 domain-containing protein [Aeromonas hydrophila]MBL0563658.1 MSHA biogenesis protein MshQ [Aeromonas hydrophila]
MLKIFLIIFFYFIPFFTQASEQGPTLNCETIENFDDGQAKRWIMGARPGSTLPYNNNRRLRMTEDRSSQSTMAVYSNLIPSKNNFIQVTYRYYSWTPRNDSNGADGVALVFSDASITPYPGGIGGSMGYAQVHAGNTNMDGFSGGWVGIGADEYGFFARANEGRVGGPGTRQNAVSIRGSEQSQYLYLVGTNTLSPPLTVHNSEDGGNGQLFRVTLDTRGVGNNAHISVERDAGGGWVKIIPSYDLSAQKLPENFYISFTAGNGSYHRFHEIDDVNVCHLKKAEEVKEYIDHFELTHSGHALTCNPEEITIKACGNADCSQLITKPVSLTLKPQSFNGGYWVAMPGMGTLDNGILSFTGGITKIQLRSYLKGTITVGVSSSIPLTKPLSTTLCRSGNSGLSTAACTINFSESGLLFNVPDTFSNQPQKVKIQAVKTDDVTRKCIPAFAGQDKKIKFSSRFINPVNNPYNRVITVNDSQVSSNNITETSLEFDALGETTIIVNYPDAGQVQLDARYDGYGEDAGLVMIGTAQFVARPVGLCITSTNESCTNDYVNCSVFKKAGEIFPLQIQAMAWEADNDSDICSNNISTPNFSLNNIGLNTKVVAPIDDGVNANLRFASYDHIPEKNGINIINQTVDDVGVFSIQARPSATYFGYNIPNTQSLPIGRFIPAKFKVAFSSVHPACGLNSTATPYSYMSQPFMLEVDVAAQNAAGAVTYNYNGDFAKGSLVLSASNNDGIPLSSRIRQQHALPWVNGKVNYLDDNALMRLSDNLPDGPYRSVYIGGAILDNDGNHTVMEFTDFNESVSGDCSIQSNCNAVKLNRMPLTFYFGRLLAGTSAGHISAPLSIPIQTQYYEEGHWLPNQFDQCTTLSLNNGGFSFPAHSFDTATSLLDLGEGRQIQLELGDVVPSRRSFIIQDGKILLHLSQPGIAVRVPYQIDLSKQPNQPFWLADPLTLNGEAIFGSNQSNDKIIYWREIF